MIHRPITTLVSFIVFIASVRAQSLVTSILGTTYTGATGYRLEFAGDLDGDAIDDLWASSLRYGVPGGPLTIGATAYSGLNGLPVLAVTRPLTPNSSYGGVLAGGRDLDLDGIFDLAMTFAPAGAPVSVELRSGLTGVQIWSVAAPVPGNFGQGLAMIGDIDGDAIGEVVVASTSILPIPYTLTGGITVLSGSSGTVIWSLPNQQTFFFSPSIADAGDVDGDGFSDIAVGFGTTYQSISGLGVYFPTHAGIALVSGAAGSVMATFSTPIATDDFGRTIDVVGDLTGDGFPEFAVAAPQANQGGVVVGRLDIVDFVGSIVRWSVFGTATNPIGSSLDAGRDCDGDGLNDIVIGSTASSFTGSNGLVRVISGATGQDIWTMTGQNSFESFGSAVALCGDIDSSGRSSVAISSIGALNTFGRVDLRLGIDGLGAPGRSSIVDPATGAFVDVLSIDGSSGGPQRRIDRTIGQPFAVQVASPPTVSSAPFAVFGLLRLPAPAEAFVLPAAVGTMAFSPCPLLPAFDSFLLTDNFGSAVCGGGIIASQPAPFVWPVFSGVPFPLTVTLQGVMLTAPGTVRATNGVLLRVR